MKRFSAKTRKKMSIAAQNRVTDDFRKRMSELHSAKLDIVSIKNMYSEGMSQAEIAKEMGVAQSVISNWMRRNRIPSRSTAKRNQWGEKNHMWKDDKASYTAYHNRVYRIKGKASICSKCRSTKWVEWACLDGDYNNIGSFTELCAKCHRNYDLRMRQEKTNSKVEAELNRTSCHCHCQKDGYKFCPNCGHDLRK